MRNRRAPRGEGLGFSLLEVLVSLLILAIGILGLAGLQTRASLVEMEAYQRAIALQFVKDMASRISASRGILADIETETTNEVFGANTTLASGRCAAPASPARQMVCDWHSALLGVAETAGDEDIGAPIGMRGCVIEDTQSPTALREFIIVGVWQGLTPTVSPADGTPGAECDPGSDFGVGMRRAIVTRVMIPDLSE